MKGEEVIRNLLPEISLAVILALTLLFTLISCSVQPKADSSGGAASSGSSSSGSSSSIATEKSKMKDMVAISGAKIVTLKLKALKKSGQSIKADTVSLTNSTDINGQFDLTTILPVIGEARDLSFQKAGYLIVFKNVIRNVTNPTPLNIDYQDTVQLFSASSPLSDGSISCDAIYWISHNFHVADGRILNSSPGGNRLMESMMYCFKSTPMGSWNNGHTWTSVDISSGQCTVTFPTNYYGSTTLYIVSNNNLSNASIVTNWPFYDASFNGTYIFNLNADNGGLIATLERKVSSPPSIGFIQFTTIPPLINSNNFFPAETNDLIVTVSDWGGITSFYYGLSDIVNGQNNYSFISIGSSTDPLLKQYAFKTGGVEIDTSKVSSFTVPLTKAPDTVPNEYYIFSITGLDSPNTCEAGFNASYSIYIKKP